MSNLSLDDIKIAAKISGLDGFTNNFEALGGGEVNDTFLLDCGTDKVILRVAKEAGQDTLKDEAKALSLLDIPNLPKLIFFDRTHHLQNRLWITETYVNGEMVSRLNVEQFRSLGVLLAKVHGTTIQSQVGINIWDRFLKNCHTFGDEHFLLNHPDPKLSRLIKQAHDYFQEYQSSLNHLHPSLVHGDATPNNTLVRGNDVSLIDWEFSKFNDPMSEFSTIYYDDMEYNRGKWRPHIKDDERTALHEGYNAAGGKVDKERLRLWMNHDKLGAAVFLYWRIHQSTRETDTEQLTQYQFDLDNLISSLEGYLYVF